MISKDRTAGFSGTGPPKRLPKVVGRTDLGATCRVPSGFGRERPRSTGSAAWRNAPGHAPPLNHGRLVSAVGSHVTPFVRDHVRHETASLTCSPDRILIPQSVYIVCLNWRILNGPVDRTTLRDLSRGGQVFGEGREAAVKIDGGGTARREGAA